jgi:hypothetical protein
VKQHQVILPTLRGQAAQPADSLLSDQFARGRRVVLEQHPQKVAQLGGIPLLHGALLRAPEQLVGVAHYPSPAELAHAVDYLGGLAAGEREIATLKHTFCTAPLDVRDHGLEPRQVAVDV